MHEEDEGEEKRPTIFTESPGYIQGSMRDYQVQGLNWMISLYENNISGILADEMGLGKTLQTVSFLGYLRYICGIDGPHLVLVPKSTLDNWYREFARWTPDVNVLVLQGDKEGRSKLIQERLLSCDFDVVVTSYEIVLREKGYFKRFAWQYIVVDEAHRLKNEQSMLSQIIRTFSSQNRLLVTGTPLQNNLHELWALLNYILPDVFSDSEQFDQWFESQGGDQDKVVEQLHRVLRPFLLRRVKADVEHSLLPKKEINLYIGMSEMQLQWYRKILEKDLAAVNGAVSKGEKTRLLNIVMQLRKCCNHPYLFEGAEPGPPYTTDEHLINNCGKMIILDKLLKKAKAQGSRVLIFSQMSRLLDIMEDYCLFRDYKYCRIDGQTLHEDRVAAIDEYNKPDSEKFVFLLTTRAGGLGINLTTADWVILYDSDWNPQADLQAMDRAHRIGQTKQVYVYRFVTENAIEEKVLERAAQKLRLDQLVIQQGRSGAQAAEQAAKTATKDDLVSMIRHGASEVFENKTKSIDEADDIDAILAKGEEKTQALNSKFEKLGLDELQKFGSDSAYEWNGKDFKQGQKATKIGKNFTWIQPAKRERKENYSIDSYYRDVMRHGDGRGSDSDGTSTPTAPKAPKQLLIYDHQFYPQQLLDIYDKETLYFRKQIGYKVPKPKSTGNEEKDKKAEEAREAEQSKIDSAEPLTEEEEELKVTLANDGYSNWNRRDFTHWVQAAGKHGRDNHEAIAAEFDDKSVADVKQYSADFWKNYKKIEGWERYVSMIENGEEKTKKTRLQKELLKKKVESYNAPLQQIQIQYTVGHGRKVYSEDEDRYLVVQMHRFGLESPTLFEQIRDAIRESPMFRFDWFFLSRTPLELSRRCSTLLTSISRELDPEGAGQKRGRGPGRKKREHSKDFSSEEEEEEEEEDFSLDDEEEEEEKAKPKKRNTRKK